MEKTPLYFTPHTQGSLMKHTDSVKGNSVVHVAERVLSKILTNKPSTKMKVTIYTTEDAKLLLFMNTTYLK